MSKSPSQDAQILKTTAHIRALEAKLARLESLQDLYETQVGELDSLLQSVGFENGLTSLREAAEELLLCDLDNE